MTEIISLRQENSKTFDLGNRRRSLDVSIGAVHYKDNYRDTSEGWKDIDLTWEGNRITKAPYELTLDGQKLTFKDKRAGEVSTIELVSAIPAGLKWEIIPENSAVRFRHILSSDKVPFEAKFATTGKIPLRTRAFDNTGELELEANLVDGVLTEKLSEVKDKQTGQVRPAKGNIKVDPGLDIRVGASADDCYVYWDGSAWVLSALNFAYFGIGSGGAAWDKIGGGMRFLNATIPQGLTIGTAKLNLRSNQTISDVTVNARITGEDVDDAATFSTLADYQARRGTIVGGANDNYITTAQVDWDNVEAMAGDVDYDSPEIKAVIQEIINRAGWASGNDIVLFLDDHDGRSTSGISRRFYSYDGSSTYAPKLHIEYTAPRRGSLIYLVMKWRHS